jgi:hypothetical protein
LDGRDGRVGGRDVGRVGNLALSVAGELKAGFLVVCGGASRHDGGRWLEEK